jgi:hypothetical protein
MCSRKLHRTGINFWFRGDSAGSAKAGMPEMLECENPRLRVNENHNTPEKK